MDSAFGFDRHDAARNVRGLSSQVMAIANHAAGVSTVPIETVIATGSAVNRAILQVMANVFGVDVYRSTSRNSARSAPPCAYPPTNLASGEPVSWKTW
jgi:sugar (pentulose or hexulose) kinase